VLIDAMAARARELGVTLRLGERLTELPPAPVIVAVEPPDARALLGDDSLRVLSGHTVCVDLAVERRRGDAFVVSDLDEAGWAERYTAADPSLAPPGEELIQSQMPIRPAGGGRRGERPAVTAPRRVTRRRSRRPA
jgi:hypothetical protein